MLPMPGFMLPEAASAQTWPLSFRPAFQVGVNTRNLTEWSIRNRLPSTLSAYMSSLARSQVLSGSTRHSLTSCPHVLSVTRSGSPPLNTHNSPSFTHSTRLSLIPGFSRVSLSGLRKNSICSIRLMFLKGRGTMSSFVYRHLSLEEKTVYV